MCVWCVVYCVRVLGCCEWFLGVCVVNDVVCVGVGDVGEC